MIVHLAAMACVLGLAVLNYYVGRRNVLYPAFLFSLIWLVVFLLYMVPLIEVNKVGAYTLAIVVCGVAAFSAGAAVVRRRTYSRVGTVSICRNTIAKRLIFLSCLVILPGFFLELRELSDRGGLDSFMISARVGIVDAVTNGEKPFSSPVYTFAPTLAIFTAFIFLIEVREWSRERIWVCAPILTAVVFSVLTTGRASPLFLISGLVGVFLLKSRQYSAKEAWKFVRWPLVATLTLFSVLVPLNKNISGMSGGTSEALAEFVFGYAVIPLAGFDYVVYHPAEYKYEPNHTFQQVLPVLARFLGFSYTPPPLLDDFVSTPIPTNVFTVFKYFYIDFGLTGMLIIIFLIGIIQTWLFEKALTGEHLYVFLFAVSLYPLLMVGFDDQYWPIRNHIVAVLFGLFYFRVLRTIPVRAGAGLGPSRSNGLIQNSNP